MVSIIEQILTGDAQKVTQFYHEFAPKILTYLKNRLPQDVAEETLSDVFLEAIDALPTLKKETNLRAWLFKIAHNKTVDYYRKKKIKYILLSKIPYLEIVASEVNEPEFQLEKNAIREKIETTLHGISKKYQRILHLHYEEQVSVKELAVVFNISTKAAESLLFRARQSFMVAYGRT